MSAGTEARERWWIALVLACAALAYFSVFRSYGINLPDEGTLLYKFERMADGQRLYADYHGGYTPGVFYVHSFLQKYLGQSILPGRVVLALVSSLSVATLFLLAAPVCGNLFAAAAALLYPAFMPVHPGHFASFNVPYPTWYSVASFLLGLLAARSFSERPAAMRALLAGLLAGAGFLFKPNVGAFQLAAAMLLVLAAVPRRGSTLVGAWWWLVWGGVLAGVLAVFGGKPGARELGVFVLPVAAAALLCARRAGQAEAAPSFGATAVPTLLVAAGFAAVTLAWLGYYAARVPFSQLLEEALFVGSDYATFFYTPHPTVLGRALLLAAGFAVAHALPGLLAKRGLVPWRAAAAVLVVAAPVTLLLLWGRPMLHGFVPSVMSEVETSWAYAAAQAAGWLLLAIAWLRRPASPALLAVVVGAPLLYAGNYPRTDFMHWVWAAPVAVVAGAALLAALAAEWSRGAARGARAAVALAFLAPLLVVGGLRVTSAFAAIFRLDGGVPVFRAGIELRSHRAPVWMNIGRAESYRDLETVVAAIRELTEPGEKVFTFPALDVVSFLSDRDSPLRDSYFFPRWIGHDDELRAVEAMRADPPRLAVVLHGHETFFEDAPTYFAAIGGFLAEQYRRYVQVGRYAILAHRSVAETGGRRRWSIPRDEPDPRLERYLETRLARRDGHELAARVSDLRYDAIEGYYPSVVDLLESPRSDVRAAAVSALRQAGGDRVAQALFRAGVSGGLPERERRLALRLAGAWAGEATAATMKGHVDDADAAVAEASRAGLERVAANAPREAAWFGGR